MDNPNSEMLLMLKYVLDDFIIMLFDFGITLYWTTKIWVH